MNIIHEKQDLTYLNWSHIRSSSGTAGTFLKSESNLDGKKTYYKLSNFDPVRGVVGHECVNEIIVERLLTLFFASTFWTKLQNIFGHYCKSKLDKVAKPRLAAILPAA